MPNYLVRRKFVNHAGADLMADGLHLTICGVVVAKKRAPLSQPVSDITCKRCRRSILAAMQKAQRSLTSEKTS